MEKENKILWAIGIATIAIIGIGAYFLSRPPKPESETSGSKVDENLLVKSDSNIKKAPSEKATLVEFGDFQCPACASYAPVVEQVLEEFNEELTFVARHFPLGQHRNALSAAYSAEAAGKQGKFWEMYDLLYKNQNDWESSGSVMKIFEDYAEDLGLDIEKFKADADLKEIKDKVQSDYTDGVTLGVSSTPTFFLSGEKLTAPKSVDDFKSLVRAAIANTSVQTNTNNSDQVYHAHFDFRMVISGKALDFRLPKYQETKSNPLDPGVHFHDGNGEVVHLHERGVSLGRFLKSIKFDISSACLTTDAGVNYCASVGNKLAVYVNNKLINNPADYVPNDLDRILITYGSETGDVLQKQIDSVGDEACIYSETCPERGKPPTEECVGGLGTGCEESDAQSAS